MMKKKSAKNISIKPILEWINDEKKSRKEMYQRVQGFYNQLIEDANRHNALANQLHALQQSINDNTHLIKMYCVSDDHKLMDVWEIETACGLTNKKYTDWKFEFEKSKEGFEFKNPLGSL